jgi:hypothetical protein
MWTYIDRELAEQVWAETEEYMTEEEKALAYAPQPVMSDEEWEACWASIRGEDGLSQTTINKAETEMERDAYLKLYNSL